MSQINKREYQCEFCDTDKPHEDRLVTLTMNRDTRWYIFENVPAQVCPNCGRRYYSGPMITRLERLIKDQQLEGASPIEAYKVPFPSGSGQ